MNRMCKAAMLPFLVTAVGACSTMQRHEAEADIPREAMEAWLEGKPAASKELYSMVLIQGERNRVLNQARAGVAAFELGAFDAAKASFTDAADRIESIYADNPEAESARSNFTKENVKDFKGAPYERAMAMYYLGLIYLYEADYENARASFKSGMLQDSMAEDKRFAQDFASLAYLEGWASRCANDADLAKKAFAEAKFHNPVLREPDPRHNTLVIFESGHGPVKGTTGEYDEQLVIAPRGHSNFIDGLVVYGARTQAPLLEAEDIFYQATTRGGREADDIMVAKADFKEGMDLAGLTMTTAGLTTMNTAAYAGDDDMAGAGATMAFAGLAASLISSATTPQADDRFWDNLPGRIHVTTLAAAPPYRFNVDVAAMHSFGGEDCQIVWGREKSALDVPSRAPNSSAKATDI